MHTRSRPVNNVHTGSEMASASNVPDCGPQVQLGLIGTLAESLIRFRGPLIEAFVASGCKVFAFATDYDERTAYRVRQYGATPVAYQLDRTGTNPARDFASSMALARQLRGRAVNVTLSYFMKPVVYGSIAARIAGVGRRFATLPGLGYNFTKPIGTLDPRQRLVANALKRLLRVSLPLNEKVFFYNNDDIAEVTRLRLVEPRRIERLNGTGVDLDSYNIAPPVTDPVTFLMACRLLAEKGVREFAAATRLVKAEYPQARFILLGGTDTSPGSMRVDEVKQLAEQSGLEWPGQVGNVEAWMEQASVYVLPSYREGVPRSTQEAMAKGRPVITTDAIGCRETVEEGRNGFLVPIGDADALAERMMRFVHRRDLITRMGAQSRRIAEERFNVHAINARILKVMGFDSALRTHAVIGSP